MPKNLYDTIDYFPLRQRVSETAGDIVLACTKAIEQETLYGFALCPDEDVQSMFWMANTEESLKVSAAKLHKQAVKYGSDQSLEQITDILRFGCVEWAYGEETLDISVPFDSDLGLDEIWSTFRGLGLSGADYDKGFASVRKHALDAIANGLKDCRKNSALSADFVLLVQFPDSGDIPELLRLAKLTNATKTYRKFKAVCEIE